MLVKIISTVWVFIILLFGGCTINDEPLFDKWVNGSYQPRTVTNYQTYGTRKGETTQVFIIFQFENDERAQLELEVTYNPIPILSSGHWRIDGNKSSAGDVRAISLKFLGGQGDGPSLGGSFQLEESSKPRFRVVIPLRPINKPKW